MLSKLGFDDRWVRLIMECVSNVEYRININGKLVGPVVPSRGLRQGDPLSPYLFLICAEGLSILLKDAEERKELSGCRVSRNAPSVSHILFADDSFLFFEASRTQVGKVKELLRRYEEASGQAVNYSKSGVEFSKNVSQSLAVELKSSLEVRQGLEGGSYLGLPSVIGRNKKSAFAHIKDRMWKRISSWTSNILSVAGKEILIKSVLQALPTYSMSVFLLPKSFCNEVQIMLNRFWWCNHINTGGIRWIWWNRISKRKSEGGMGFRELENFNLALLSKQAWKLITEPDSLVSKILKERYFPKHDYWDAKLGSSPSQSWRSLLACKNILRQGSRWLVGDGSKIKVWEDNWLRGENKTVASEPLDGFGDLKVKDLFIPETRRWNMDLIRGLFVEEDVRAITSLPRRAVVAEDRIIWDLSKNGIFSVKSAYHMSMGTRSIAVGQEEEDGWRQLWNLKLPPKIKIFCWKLASGALPTRVRLAERGIAVPTECPLCRQQAESDMHLFEACPQAQECLAKAGVTLPTNDSSSYGGEGAVCNQNDQQ